uniref:Methyltransferase domain-containing protein n=1 Tax=Thermogemmatispora argillosa TaxID=2045280 RepID=A0A455SV02_9CHLR|nr:hypothetical protein KTA_04060 [Thermogemmatispora argillosa]
MPRLGLWPWRLGAGIGLCLSQVQIPGVDLSPQMIAQTREQTCSRGLEMENAHFQVTDVLLPLAPADGSFELLSSRLLCSFLLPAAWPLRLSECRYLLKSGGVIRLTEGEKPLATSGTLERISALGTQALRRAGQHFSPNGGHVGIPQCYPGWSPGGLSAGLSVSGQVRVHGRWRPKAMTLPSRSTLSCWS